MVGNTAAMAVIKATSNFFGRCSFMRRGERRLVEMRWSDTGKEEVAHEGKAMPGDNATIVLRA